MQPWVVCSNYLFSPIVAETLRGLNAPAYQIFANLWGRINQISGNDRQTALLVLNYI